MSNLILLQYSNALQTNSVKDFLESQTEITNWVSFFPNSFLLKTNLNAQQVSERFDTRLGQFLHLTITIDKNYWGRLSDWGLFNPTQYQRKK